MEILEKPSAIHDDMRLSLSPRILSGKDVLSLRHVAKSFDEHCLFTDTNLEIKRGDHVAIIGDNGTGKTTLLKMINGLTDLSEGEMILGAKVDIGYYDQEHHVLHEEKSLFEEISDSYPNLTNTQIRNTLAAFLFTGDDVFKKIKSLSGGERGRVSLAKLMLSNANFLILDEPTNHLDITSKEILEQALNQYEGTVLYVSHDRFFVNKTAHRIFALENGHFYEYQGNYDDYLEKRDVTMQAFAKQKQTDKNPAPQCDSALKEPNKKIATKDDPGALAEKNAETQLCTEKTSDAMISSNKLSWQEQKEQQAQLRKKQNQLKKCEEEIEKLEKEVAMLHEKLADIEIATNSVKLQEVAKKLDTCNEQLEKRYEEWELLSE